MPHPFHAFPAVDVAREGVAGIRWDHAHPAIAQDIGGLDEPSSGSQRRSSVRETMGREPSWVSMSLTVFR